MSVEIGKYLHSISCGGLLSGEPQPKGLEMEQARDVIPACAGITEKMFKVDKLLLLLGLSYLLAVLTAFVYYPIVMVKITTISIVVFLTIVFLDDSSRSETMIWVVGIGVVLCYILF